MSEKQWEHDPELFDFVVYNNRKHQEDPISPLGFRGIITHQIKDEYKIQSVLNPKIFDEWETFYSYTRDVLSKEAIAGKTENEVLSLMHDIPLKRDAILNEMCLFIDQHFKARLPVNSK